MNSNFNNPLTQKIGVLGCGWLGVPVAEMLLNKGFKVNGSTTTLQKMKTLENRGITSFLININQLTGLVDQFLDVDILIIAISHKNISDFEKLILRIENSRIEKVIFLSSISIYTIQNQKMDEKAIVKDCALSNIEEMFRQSACFQTTILRFGGLFGYDRKPTNFITKTRLMKNPNGYVNLIHRDDCIQIIYQIILQNCWEQTLNACSDSHPTRREFYEYVSILAGHPAPKFEENSTKEYKIISSKKLKGLLNYRFQYPDIMKIRLEDCENISP